ncbi:MAG TPA: hypothetical protein VJZ51_01225 [Bacilli bacterium]|nr:hypothetical protein [Bacilli bacterium]
MSECNFVDNNGLIELVERGLRKGYWDKALIPELKKRFKEIEKKEKLLELYRKLDDCIVAPNGHHVCRYTDDEKYARIRKQIKELENE